MKIFALSASLRAASSSSALLRVVARLAPADWQFTFYDRQLGALPHFSPDLDGEEATPPPPVAELRALLSDADALVIACPEYAHGVPGSFKNALDWLVSSGELARKPTALLMASPSGAPFARAALVPTLEVLEAKLLFNEPLRFARADIDAAGNPSAALADGLRHLIATLAAAVA